MSDSRVETLGLPLFTQVFVSLEMIQGLPWGCDRTRTPTLCCLPGCEQLSPVSAAMATTSPPCSPWFQFCLPLEDCLTCHKP